MYTFLVDYIPPDDFDEKTEPMGIPAYRPQPISYEPKCECGCDKTYGPDNKSHLPYCPKYREWK